jgi:dipeptidyl-peptidase 4
MNSRSFNYRIIVSLFVGILFFTTGGFAQKKPIGIKDVFGNMDLMGSRAKPMQWMKDGVHYTFTKRDTVKMGVNIWKADARTGNEELFAEIAGLTMPGKSGKFRFQSYTLSAQENFILFTLNTSAIWRRSTVGSYIAYSLKEKKLYPLPAGRDSIRNVKISPDEKWIGYVYQDNIYAAELATGKEVQLTNDATETSYNGRFGWVYEEEFSIVDGWQWSPDSKTIAYWHEDESKIPVYNLTNWMPLHLELIPIRYPKPGDPNPIEKIGVVSIETRERVWIDLGMETDLYIPRIKWTTDPNTLCVYRLNRLQNHLELLFADVKTGSARVVHEEKSPNGWLDVENGTMLYFFKKDKQFLWASERDGFNHLFLVNYEKNSVKQITKGSWDVTEAVGVSSDEKWVYYTSTEVSPMERHLYKIRMDGEKKEKLTKEEGYHSISMSPGCFLYTDTWSSTKHPSMSKLFDTGGDEIKVLAEAKTDVYAKYAWSPKELLTVKTSDGLDLYCSMIKPPDFDPSKKYPVIYNVYGGPGSQSVRNAWPSSMDEWMANEGFIVFQIDNRGGSARGTDFKFRVYKQLGKWEVNDYVEGAKYLSSLAYVDKDNLGIWGWSYGGYIAALTALLGADYFKAAVAIAPPTDWRFYDTIYAERYMQTPQLNPDGYKVGSCIEHADKLKGKLLLVHGGVDDNVHLQNTMQFIDKLEEAGKQFDMRIYPNGDHGVAGGMDSRYGLFLYFMNFFAQHLQGKVK